MHYYVPKVYTERAISAECVQLPDNVNNFLCTDVRIDDYQFRFF